MYRISYTFDISRSFVYNLICSRGVAQFGGAPGLGPGGRRFESCHLDFWWNYGRISLKSDTIPKYDVMSAGPSGK